MDPVTLMLIGAGVGAGAGLINNNQKQAEYNRQKELAATLAQYSPWTGIDAMSYMPKSQPNAFNSMLQGGLTGATFVNGLGLGKATTEPEVDAEAAQKMMAENPEDMSPEKLSTYFDAESFFNQKKKMSPMSRSVWTDKMIG